MTRLTVNIATGFASALVGLALVAPAVAQDEPCVPHPDSTAFALDATAGFLRYYLGRPVRVDRERLMWEAYPGGVERSWKVSMRRTKSASPFTRKAEAARVKMLVHRFDAGS